MKPSDLKTVIDSDGFLSFVGPDGLIYSSVQFVADLAVSDTEDITEFWNCDDSTPFTNEYRNGAGLVMYVFDPTRIHGSRIIAEVLIRDFRACKHVLVKHLPA